ncbi:hypothetical protein B0H10DRAFT_2241038, partial [Mycena sp. CBHHK59/15]
QQLRETRYWKGRQEKKAVVAGDVPDVHSKEAKAAFAKKRKGLEDAAAKKKRAKDGKKPTESMDTSV